MTPALDFGERLALRGATSPTPVQELARELAADLEPLISALTDRVLTGERRLQDRGDPTLVALTQRFVYSTAGAVLSALAYGVPTDAARPTDASIALFERLAEREDGLAIALRAQRLLHAELWQYWAAFTDGRIRDRTLHRALLATSTRDLEQYTDCVCECLAIAWPQTRRRRRHGLDVSVQELANRAVFASAETATAALSQLAYPIGGFHLAVALPDSIGDAALDNLARRLKLACAAHILAADATIWIGFARPASATDIERAGPLLDLDVPIGIGDPGTGLEGFRRTRQQAADALRVARLSGAAGVTKYRDVALLAVLTADETRARALARIELGPLAGDDELSVRLRETISAYLAEGESQVATAKRLFIHEKTVKYRLRQAEELLGRTISERRSELGAALMVHRVLTL